MTIEATVFAYLFIHIGLVLVVTAYFTVGSLLVPQLIARARGRFARRPWLPLLVGLAVSAPWAAAAIFLLSADNAMFKFAGALTGSMWILAGLIGGAAIAQHVGGATRAESATWVHAFRGGLFLTMTWVLPILGWLVALPLTLATGTGCLLLGLWPASTAPGVTALPAGA